MEKISSLLPTKVSKYQSFGDDQELTPVSISWHNITVFSRNNGFLDIFRKEKDRQKNIIKNVSGKVRTGQLLAILGSSGAGKTTLLNVLTGRSSSNLTVEGMVKLNGLVVDKNQLRSVSAFVQQMDLFFTLLTVKEHLIFQSLLRMDKKLSRNERKECVKQVIHKFNLTKCCETLIANISGGESKRLSFASEVLTNPSLMFCDEPTSGLDSFMAKNIVNTMKMMSTEGRTIICTIHQPSSQVFELFEKLLLMADGRVAYMGCSHNVFNFFSTLGYNCPKNHNPSDYYVEQLAIIPGEEKDSKIKINNICNHYLKTVSESKNDKNVDKFDDKSHQLLSLLSNGYQTNSWHQFWILLKRSFITSARNPSITKVRISVTFVFAVCIGLLFQKDSDQNHVMNVNGAIFFMLIFVGQITSYTVINTFCDELPLFLKEHHNRMYSVGTYFMAKVFSQLPIFFVVPVIYVLINFHLIDLNRDFHIILTTLLIAILLTNCGISFGYLLSCASSSTAMAASLSQPILIFFLLFSGYFFNNQSINPWIVWCKYFSWFYYGFEAFMINQWRDVDYIACNEYETINETKSSFHCYNTGRDVIMSLGFDESHLRRNLFMLLIISLLLSIMAFIVLCVKAKRK